MIFKRSAMRKTMRLFAVVVQASVAGMALGTDGTYLNTASNIGNYGDPGNWASGTIATGVNATATIDLDNPTGSSLTSVYLNQNVTLGTLLVTNSGTLSRNLQVRGNGGTDIATRPVLTFATTSGMPRFILSSAGTTPVTYAMFSGTPSVGTGWILASTQGLYMDLGTGWGLDVLSSTSPWVSGYFSGPLVIGRGTYNNQFTGAGGVPVVHLAIGDAENPSYVAALSFRDSVAVQGIDGTANGWILNNSSGTTLFTQNSQNYLRQNTSTLTFGTNNDSGTFNGTVGRAPGEAANVYKSNLALVKDGTGTQRFNGAMYHSGVTAINAGTLVINGTHTAVLNSGFSAYGSLSVGAGGTYLVSGALAGNGTIKPHETLGAGTMITVNSGGVISPGDGGVGTFTLDGSDSLAPLLNVASGGFLNFDVAASSAADVLAIINAQASDVTFNSNTINLNALPGFGAGTYTLLTSDAANVYSGLTVDGSGVITAGLQIDSGFLSTYAGSTLKLIGNDIVLNAVGGASGLTWAGPIGAPWDHATNSFTGTGGPTAFADGNAVTFADTAVGTVVLTGNLVPSSMTVNNAAGTYVFTGGGSISGAASLVKSGAGTLVIESGNAYTGGTTVSAGTLVAAKLDNGTLAISGGTVQLSAKPLPNQLSGTTVVPALSISAGAKLDVTNNTVVIDYTSEDGATLAATVRQQLADGRLLTSLPGSGNRIGYADTAVLGAGTFGGVGVDASSIVVLYTFGGDANLDGKVNTIDFNLLAGGFGTGSTWLAGDFDYNAVVDSVDFGIFVGNHGAQLPAASLGTVVPEPTTLAGIACACAMGCRRSWRAYRVEA